MRRLIYVWASFLFCTSGVHTGTARSFLCHTSSGCGNMHSNILLTSILTPPVFPNQYSHHHKYRQVHHPLTNYLAIDKNVIVHADIRFVLSMFFFSLSVYLFIFSDIIILDVHVGFLPGTKVWHKNIFAQSHVSSDIFTNYNAA